MSHERNSVLARFYADRLNQRRNICHQNSRSANLEHNETCRRQYENTFLLRDRTELISAD